VLMVFPRKVICAMHLSLPSSADRHQVGARLFLKRSSAPS
jgi:hypothetical protein